MKRVVIVGSSGSGKTTMARKLADLLGVPHIELDAIHHQSDWEALPDDEFLAEVAGQTEADGWIADGNYPIVSDLLWEAADTVIWLDFSRPLVMRRIAVRTLSRLIFRRTLWNGNKERIRNFLSRDPDRNLFLWTWTRHRQYRRRFAARSVDARWQPLEVIRLPSPEAVAAFERALTSAAGPPLE